MKQTAVSAVALVALCAAPLASIAQSAGFAHFISIDREGVLRDGPAVFRYVGANMSEVTHIRTDWDLAQRNRFRLPTTDEIDWMVEAAAQGNFRVIRTWCFPSHLQPENPVDTWYFSRNDDATTVTLNEMAFRLFDYFLERCAQKGIRAQVPFVYLYQTREWADSAGDPHPQLLDFVRQLLMRVNTRTGIRYLDDPTIYCWESGNEAKPSARWIAKLASFVKRIDRNHLFMDGRWGPVDVYESYFSDSTLCIDPNIDVVSYHTYQTAANDWTPAETMQHIHRRLKVHGKALDIGEIGPATSVETLREYLDTIVQEGIGGVSWWSFKGARAKGGYTQWNSRRYGGSDDLKWPGFMSPLTGVATEKAKIDLLCAASYAINGQTRPTILPAPTAAKLLPIANVGHISWIPGTGEQTADIERATSPAGGFKVVAADFATFKGSTYDLFCDASATVGESYYYRIRSRNTGGAAPYSNVIGPVKVSGQWLVDDLWDLSQMKSYSRGAVIDSSYDLVPYHCDMSVLKATGAAESITYEVSGLAERVYVIANNETTTLALEGSVDGRTYQKLDATRTVFPPLHPEFNGHPRIACKADRIAAYSFRFIRINFGSDDVISRVEILHAGPKY